MIRIRVQAFGGLKDALGPDWTPVVLREGATVSDLLEHLRQRYPAELFQGIAISVNAEYALPAQPLCQGDEVGLLPPVSGGSGEGRRPARRGARPAAVPAPESAASPSDDIRLTEERIDAASLVAAAKRAEDGAVVVFDGIVRNHSRGRETLYLEYEAYAPLALKQMKTLAVEARQRFAVRAVCMVHRTGRLAIGETSVLIVVSSAHRAQAFEACRWLIDTLKKTVPIWKKETFVDGAVWADGEPFPPELGTEACDAG